MQEMASCRNVLLGLRIFETASPPGTHTFRQEAIKRPTIEILHG